MSTSSELGTEHGSRPAPVFPLPVPAPRDSAETAGSGLASLLAAVRTAAVEQEELAAQDRALADESVDLRAQASRYASVVEGGGTVEIEAVEAVLRAFRSYEPFLGARDRMLNAAAYRRLADAVAEPGTPPDSQVA